MKSVKRKDGWWITELPECNECEVCENCGSQDDVGPYDTKSEAEDDQRGLARTEKAMDKRAFWTCEKNVQPLTPVVLRRYKSKELFALFPEEAIDGVPENCKCYGLSLDGYAAADYTKCMRISGPATAKEAEKILTALRKLGWKNLKVIQRATSLMHKKRMK
jgi:hypothetical protein